MSKFKLQSLIFILVAFMLGCNEFIVVGILSDLSKQFQVPISIMGYLVTIFATVYAVSTPFVTVLTSRYNRYKTLLSLMLVFLIGNTLSGLATNYIFMVISRIITATTAGSIISLVMTFASTIRQGINVPAWSLGSLPVSVLHLFLECPLALRLVPVITGAIRSLAFRSSAS